MILIVDMNMREGGLGRGEFVRPIADILEPVYEVGVAHYSKLPRAAGDGVDALILSGAPLMDTGYADNPGCFEFLAEYEKPVLGVCAGMQAICLAFGGDIYPCQEIGVVDVSVLAECVLFKRDFRGYAMHNLACRFPVSFRALAKSDKCIQAVKHGGREIYGVLFHPEARTKHVVENYAKHIYK